MKGMYKYFRQTTNSKFYPHYMKIVNDLARSTSFMTSHFYKHLRIIFPYHNDNTSLVWLGTFSILTMGFANTEHIDKRDLVNTISTLFKSEFKKLEEDESLLAMLKTAIQVAKIFVEDFGVCVPTTCGYQFVSRKLRNLYRDSGLVVCQLFLMSGIGVYSCIHNFWTQIFQSFVCNHTASVAIYILNDRASFGDCLCIDIVAWGKGSTKRKGKKS